MLEYPRAKDNGMLEYMESKSIEPILLISPLPPPLGGMATWTQSFYTHGLPSGVPIYLVNTKLRGKRFLFDKASFSFIEIYRNLYVICSLIYHLFIKRPKIIHLNCAVSPMGVLRDLLCVYLAKLFKVKVVTQYHGNVPDFDKNKLFGVSGWILRKLFLISSLNILTNKQSLQSCEQIAATAKKLLLPNFIEEEIFKFEKLPKHNERIQIIFVGGITIAKGGREILSLSQLYPQIDFHLYGKLHNDMRSSFTLSKPNVHLHGEVEHEQVLKAMSQSDLLLFPSYTEGFPLTVLEAMAIGLPIIASNVGAIGEMIDAAGGFLIQPRDVMGLAKAIDHLLLDDELRENMGKYNRKKSYDNYRYSIVTQKLEAIYGQVLCVA